jgi:hypothetical protein
MQIVDAKGIGLPTNHFVLVNDPSFFGPLQNMVHLFTPAKSLARTNMKAFHSYKLSCGH